MKLYSYVIPRDYGFAPNPYYDYCTLATCKPIIRRCAQVGDWIAAYGAAGTPYRSKLVVLMQVQETLTFDQYWEDDRFIKKRPVFNKGMHYMYGDNIYHHVNGVWMQEPSHHSHEDGSINYVNLQHDTQTDRVLIATEFFYFGNKAIELPREFDDLIGKGRNHQTCKDEHMIESLVSYIREKNGNRIQGVPYSRETGKFAHYGGEKK